MLQMLKMLQILQMSISSNICSLSTFEYEIHLECCGILSVCVGQNKHPNITYVSELVQHNQIEPLGHIIDLVSASRTHASKHQKG